MEAENDVGAERPADELPGRSLSQVAAHLNPDVFFLRRAYIQEQVVPELLPFEKDAVESLTEQLKGQQAELDEQSVQAAEAAVKKPKATVAFATSSVVAAAEATESPILTATARSLYATDIERVKYLLASYLRTRIRKIESQHFYLMRLLTDDPALFEERYEDVEGEPDDEHPEGTTKKVRRFPLLSEPEKQYLRTFSPLRIRHLITTVDWALPVDTELWSGSAEGSSTEVEQLVASSKPSLKTHVFAQFLESATGLVADESSSGSGAGGGGGGAAAVDEEPLDLQEGRDGILPYFYIRKLLLEGKVKVH